MRIRRFAHGGQSGQSIIQVMVGSSIFMIVAMAITSLISNQNKESQSVREKLAANDFQQQLTRVFASGDLCTHILTPPVQPIALSFDSTTAVTGSTSLPSIILTNASIPSSTLSGASALATPNQPVSPITPTLKADSVSPFKIVNIVGSHVGGVGKYTADFQISFQNNLLVRGIRPASTQIQLQTTGAGNTQTIVSCTSIGPSDVLVAVGSNDISTSGDDIWRNMGLSITFSSPTANKKYLVTLNGVFDKGGWLQFQILMDGTPIVTPLRMDIDANGTAGASGGSWSNAPLNLSSLITMPDTSPHTITAQWRMPAIGGNVGPSVQRGTLAPRLLYILPAAIP